MAREPPNTTGLIQGRPPYLKNITHTHTHIYIYISDTCSLGKFPKPNHQMSVVIGNKLFCFCKLLFQTSDRYCLPMKTRSIGVCTHYLDR